MRVVMVIFAVVLVVFSCRKSAPELVLPPISHNGEQSLGFFLNGEVWLPYDRGNYEQHELPNATLSNGHFKMSSTRIDEDNYARNWFCLEIESGCTRPGVYTISNRTCSSPYQSYYYGENKDKPQDIYQIDSIQPHFIEIIHIDTNKQTISGVFAFDAVSNAQDTIRVRSGRFDLNFDK